MANGQEIQQIGRYQILGLLGEGAMAKVYKAVDTRIDRVVAIKMLQFREGMTDEMVSQLRDRFVHEAKFAGKLTHPNIVTIYDAEEENGTSFMAMEYVDGRTMETMIENLEQLSVEQMLDLMIQVCHGLDFAHKHDIIHRDIKPGNIIVTTDDIAKIMDFGIAKITTQSTTAIGTILGTPGYMSPEQITGKPVDHRTDIFALGAVFYELVTHQKAFPGNNLTEIMYRVVSENPMPPSMVNNSLPSALNDVIMKALNKNPNERFQTGNDFAKAITVVKEGKTSTGTVFTRSTLIAKIPFDRFLSLFDNRVFSMISFGWAVLASILLLALWIKGSGGWSPLAMSLSKQKPAALSISMNVPDAEVLIDGQLYRSNGSTFRLDSIGVGEKRITIRRDHYEPYETAIVFGKGETKRVEARLKLLPVEIPNGSDTSYVSIQSTPPMVRIETSYGKFLGFTPIDSLIFPGGKYTVVFSKNDYVARKRDISLRKNKLTTVEAALEKQRGMISLEKVFPENTLLFAGGRRVPKTAKANILSVEVGEQAITIKAEGYEDISRGVRVIADSTLVLTDSLKPQFGSVLIQSNPAEAEIYLDDKDELAGKTPVQVDRLLANIHKLRAVYKSEKKNTIFKVNKADTTSIKVVFSNPNGYLQVVTDPPGAEIYLNTVRDGDAKTPTVRELKPGFYKVRLVHPNFRKYYEATIRVRPDAAADVSYKFEN